MPIACPCCGCINFGEFLECINPMMKCEDCPHKETSKEDKERTLMIDCDYYPCSNNKDGKCSLDDPYLCPFDNEFWDGSAYDGPDNIILTPKILNRYKGSEDTP